MARLKIGDLSARELTERLGISLTDSEYEQVEPLRIKNANRTHREHGWHIFYSPCLQIVCGDKEVADLWTEILSPHNKEMQDTVFIMEDWEDD